MIRPTLDEFHTLARTHTVIPVWRELLADLLGDAGDAFLHEADGITGFIAAPDARGHDLVEMGEEARAGATLSFPAKKLP